MQVSFVELGMAAAELKDFDDSAAVGADAGEFYRIFTAESYVETEAEKAEAAFQSWIQFKEKAKNIVLVRVKSSLLYKIRFFSFIINNFIQAYNSLQEQFSDCLSATGYQSAFAPILDKAKKHLGFTAEVVQGLCHQMHDLH